MRTLHGIAASPGIAIGNASILDRRAVKMPKYHIIPAEVPAEVERFRAGLSAAGQQLKRLKEKVAFASGAEHTAVLEAHQMMLQDVYLEESTISRIESQRINAEWAVSKAVHDIKRAFEKVEDDYFRERRSDVGFVADYLLTNLAGTSREETPQPAEAVVVAHDLSPADAARLHRNHIKAFVTDRGGRTSHTAILARSLGVPAVVGLQRATTVVGADDLVVVDGDRGVLVVEPNEQTLGRYRRRMDRRAQTTLAFKQVQDLPAITEDGVSVTLLANVELPEEIPEALALGAVGVGLYRSEFLFLGRKELPDEEAHYRDAMKVVRHCAGRPVTFRTFDLGGDKLPQQVPLRAEVNPALGLRSIRLSLLYPQLFKDQLRGVLRAAVHGPIQLMFPMISGLGEFRQAKALFEQCRDELRSEGHEVPDVPLGAMVETPAAAIIADVLAEEADFFSIGTNDLTQYTLAIDRANQQVNHLFQACHPAVLRLIRRVVRAARQSGVPLSVCGEMAADPVMTLLLLGLGVTALSMNGPALSQIKRVVRGSTLASARQVVDWVMELKTAQEVEEELRRALVDRFPALSSAFLGQWDEDTVEP